MNAKKKKAEEMKAKEANDAKAEAEARRQAAARVAEQEASEKAANAAREVTSTGRDALLLPFKPCLNAAYVMGLAFRGIPAHIAAAVQALVEWCLSL